MKMYAKPVVIATQVCTASAGTCGKVSGICGDLVKMT